MTDRAHHAELGGAGTGSPATEAFRHELVSFLDRELTDEVRQLGQGVPDWGQLEKMVDWNRRLADARMGRAGLAGRVRRPRRRHRRAAGLPGRDERPLCTGSDQRHRGLQHRPGHHGLRHHRAAAAVPPPHAAGRRDLVPGDVRARRRLRSGLVAHPRGGRRRRVRHQRPEDLEQPRPHRRLVPALRPDRSRRPQAQGDQLLSGRPAHPGHRGPPGHAPSPASMPFSELFFTDARIPASALLGPLNEGWTVAMTTLSFERAGVARLHLGLSRKLDHLLADPGRRRCAVRPAASATGWPASTPTSPACAG